MSVDSAPLYPQAVTCPAGSVSYAIKPGDTFYTLAQRLGTTAAAIAALNPGVNPNALQISQLICVPSAGPSPGACPSGALYTIRSGDTFYILAARYGITVQALLAANPGVDPSRLVVGQTICIPGAAPPPFVLIPTPFCSLLLTLPDILPTLGDIPIGSVTVRQVAMSTRAYTIVASPLPSPSSLGAFDAYVGVLSLISDDPSRSPEIINIRLLPSSVGNQPITWAGSMIATEPPIVGDFSEIRPLNTVTGKQGPVIMRGDFVPCRS